MLSSLAKLSVGKKDSAVAVIIGALLTFVIVASLMTAYVLWYVPSNGQQQDLQYISETENSFLQLQDQINNATPYPNDFVGQSFTLGVPGTPPFSSSTDSFLGYTNGSGFIITMSYNMTVTVSYDKVVRTIPFNYTFNSSGEFYLDTETPFVTPTNFYYQSDTIILQQPASNYSEIVGSLPISFGVNAKNLYLNASQFSVEGTNSSTGGYGVTLMTMQYSNINQSSFFLGENVTVSNLTGGYTSAIVDNITLNSFNFSIVSPQAFAWNYALASLYNSTASQHKWGNKPFTWQPFAIDSINITANPKGDLLNVGTTHILYPFSVNFGYFALRLLQL